MEIFPLLQNEEIEYQTISENYDLLFKQPRLQLSKETYNNLKVCILKSHIKKTEENINITIQTCKTLEKQLDEFREKNTALEKECTLLQQQIKLGTQECDRPAKIGKKTVRKQKLEQDVKQKKPVPIGKERQNVKKFLMKQYGVLTKQELTYRLTKKVENMQFEEEINSRMGAYLDSQRHLLIEEINKEWILIFSPCTSGFLIEKKPYPCPKCVLDELAKNILCKNNISCRNIEAKNTTVYCHMTSTGSDSDTVSDVEQRVSKEQMEKF